MATRRRSQPPESPPAPYARPVPPGSALLAPAVANIFQELGINVAVWTKRGSLPEEWYPIHVAPNISAFEVEHGVVLRRYAYNYRSFERVLRSKASVLGLHAGFNDLFLPIGDSADVRRVLVAGPFMTSLSTADQILDRWYGLTRTKGRLADPSFSQYVSATLSTLTLEGPLFAAFQRLLSSFGGLVSGQGASAALAAEAEAMRHKLFEARFAERMGDAARAMLDERKTRTWATHSEVVLSYLGLKRAPTHALVGFLLQIRENPDPLDELLRCHAFQRASADLARKTGDVVAGHVGDRGVVFLAAFTGSGAGARVKLSDLAARAGSMARRFGLSLHAGISLGVNDEPLPARYRAALMAAEHAVSRGLSLVHDEPRPDRSEHSLRRLRRSLPRGIEAEPQLLHTRFEQYVERVAAHAGRGLEGLKSELDAGLERLTEPLIGVGLLDEKAFDDMCQSIDRTTTQLATFSALVAPYRQLVSEIQAAIQRPTAARRDRATESAVAFIREHLSEPLSLVQIARVAGFAPTYFSRLFKRNEKTTLQDYILKLRIARAAEMLRNTQLSIERTRQLSGFRTRGYFNRVFKRAHGLAPISYRRTARAKLDSRTSTHGRERRK